MSRRRVTEAAILDAARTQFAASGFERATIRGIAAIADIDPALVMQYYGNKEKLFAAAAQWQIDAERLSTATDGDLAVALFEGLFDAFERPVSRGEALALLRNCLTHDGARAVVRDDVLGKMQALLAAGIKGEDAELRAALLLSTALGLIVARYLMEMPAVSGVDLADIERLVEPILRAFVTGEGL